MTTSEFEERFQKIIKQTIDLLESFQEDFEANRNMMAIEESIPSFYKARGIRDASQQLKNYIKNYID